jgi:hypothetical protein
VRVCRERGHARSPVQAAGAVFVEAVEHLLQLIPRADLSRRHQLPEPGDPDPCKIRRLPLDCHCNSGVNRPFRRGIDEPGDPDVDVLDLAEPREVSSVQHGEDAVVRACDHHVAARLGVSVT